ncbi:MAG: Wzz/FepE/Etk N-terminal domain-containing protein [Chloroflexota bacterium]|nr:Wzz/FepE/Etk N-terminal domain-containing protein [Chloroflexota bacterium]
MESGSAADRAVDLHEYVQMLRRRWWALLLVPAIVAFAAFWFVSQRAPTYRATAVLLVTQASSLGVTTSNDIQAAGLLTQTYAQLASSPEILELAAPSLPVPRPVTDLFGHVQARANPLTQLISVEAAYEDPQLAADVANATANAFVVWLAQRENQLTGESAQALREDIEQARTRVESTSSELTELRGQPGARTSEENGRIASLETLLSQYEATYANLLDIQNRLSLATLAAQGQVSTVTAARAPGSPTGYPDWLYAAIASIFGLGVAGLGVVVVESLDRRVREPADVHRAVDLPVLVSIPKGRSPGRAAAAASLDTRRADVAEAFRALRTRFQFSDNEHALGTIVVLRSDRDARPSTVATDLAMSFAEQGRRVVMVDGDFEGQDRHRDAGQFALKGMADLVGRRPESMADILIAGPHPNFKILPPGRQSPGRGMNLLTRERVGQIIEELRAHADVIVINPSATGSTSDTLLLAGAADAAIIVVEAGITRVDRLQDTLDEIAITGVYVLGVVLDGVPAGRGQR